MLRYVGVIDGEKGEIKASLERFVEFLLLFRRLPCSLPSCILCPLPYILIPNYSNISPFFMRTPSAANNH